MTKIYFLTKDNLQALLDALTANKFKCVGPQVRDGSIIYAPLNDAKKLPWGVADIQDLGDYQLTKGDPDFAFAWTNGLSSIKTFLFKPQETVWQVKRDDAGKLVFEPVNEIESIALIGVRPCDVAAMLIQDKVFLEGEHKDCRYQARKSALFTVVMNCTKSSANCFCIAAGNSPKAEKGFDLAMTELSDGFIIQAGSDQGVKLVDQLDLSEATQEQLTKADSKIEFAKNSQQKTIPNMQSLANKTTVAADDPSWNEVSEQCISCGSCTQVCPTCFCHKEMDLPLMSEEGNEHIRSWDSCFSDDHGYTHGHIFRQGTKKHYQQWLNHKFIYWHEQFGTSGCVGCGRCMTWCPAKIDITKVVGKIYHD